MTLPRGFSFQKKQTHVAWKWGCHSTFDAGASMRPFLKPAARTPKCKKPAVYPALPHVGKVGWRPHTCNSWHVTVDHGALQLLERISMRSAGSDTGSDSLTVGRMMEQCRIRPITLGPLFCSARIAEGPRAVGDKGGRECRRPGGKGP